MVAPKVSLWATLFSCLRSIHSAPTVDEPSSQVDSAAYPSMASCFSCQKAIPYMLDDVESLLFGPWSSPDPTVSSNILSDQHQYPFSFSYMSTPSPSTTESTLTITITKEEVTTVTVSLSPTTVTEIITVTSSIIPSTPTNSAPNDLPTDGTKTAWSSPPDMTDLSSFQISKFAGGEKNMKIIVDAPSRDNDSDLAASSQGNSVPDSDSSVMQLLYPANSIDPANKPQGGAEFYASPIDISNAHNVTMGYSVFFPENFDWVLGGKLPGLYGGHTGCSGGNAALDCFSTRLMWREDGEGELYLYAPKDKQTEALCSDPNSVCDATYGLSVGRGLFNWQAGSWTTVKQTVVLNTPGNQDGRFTLHVNGEQAIHRDDIFYRDDLKAKKASPSKTTKTTRPKKTSTKHPAPTSTSDDGDDGGLLGPILGGILGIRRRGTPVPEGSHDDSRQIVQTTLSDPLDNRLRETRLQPRGARTFDVVVSTTGVPVTATTTAIPVAIESVEESEVKFVGIFFSTFFGGHESKYATPQDQYVWFKDFSLAYNA